MLELAVNRFMPETWAKMTGLPYLTDEQAAQAQAAMQQATQAAMAQNQPPPQLPPIPPKWSDVLALLKNDLQREYKIDIETNSTVDPDASEAKKNMGELMAAMSQFLNGVGPLVQEGVLPIEAAKAMLLGVARQYEFGSEVEDLIRQMQPPKPQAQDKSGEQALQTQLAKSELEKQGMAQNAEAEKKSYDLGLREAALKAANADLAAREELFRIQTTAAKGQIQSDNKVSLAQHKQVKDEAVGRVEQIAKEIDLKLQHDAKTRATEKQAADKVSAEKEKSAAKGASLEGLLKELNTTLQALTKATLTPKERKLVKDPKTGKTTGMVEAPSG
jgi:hypothetical protein